MPRYVDGLAKFAELRKERQRKKALRLAQNKPKWKDEKVMKKEEYEAYIDKYLILEEGEGIPNESQTKIAVKMYENKSKEKDAPNPLDGVE